MTLFPYPVSDSMSHVQDHHRRDDNVLLSRVRFVTSAQVLALNATPRTLLAAPGAGRSIFLESMTIDKPAGTAYTIAAGKDLCLKYTDGSGFQFAQIETTGFLDQATRQTRLVMIFGPTGVMGTPANSSFTPTENAAVVLHMLTGEVTTGTSPLRILIQYRVITTDLSAFAADGP